MVCSEGRVRVMVAVGAVLWLSGCYSYGAIYRFQDGPGPPMTAGDREVAIEIAHAFAERHTLYAESWGDLSEVVLGDGWTLIAQYHRARGPDPGSNLDGTHAQLAISVAASPDGSKIRFSLHDLSHGSETAYFRELRAELQASIEAAFPGRGLAVESGRVGGRFFGP